MKRPNVSTQQKKAIHKGQNIQRQEWRKAKLKGARHVNITTEKDETEKDQRHKPANVKPKRTKHAQKQRQAKHKAQANKHSNMQRGNTKDNYGEKRTMKLNT